MWPAYSSNWVTLCMKSWRVHQGQSTSAIRRCAIHHVVRPKMMHVLSICCNRLATRCIEWGKLQRLSQRGIAAVLTGQHVAANVSLEGQPYLFALLNQVFVVLRIQLAGAHRLQPHAAQHHHMPWCTHVPWLLQFVRKPKPGSNLKLRALQQDRKRTEKKRKILCRWACLGGLG